MQVNREANILKQVMLKASDLGITIWRNNVGKAWMGKKLAFTHASIIGLDGRTRHFTPADGVILKNPRFVEFGLTPGASDLIGVEPYTVQPSDVGRKLGVFVALEVKTKSGRVAAKQQHFIDHVLGCGGRADTVRSPDDLLRQTHRNGGSNDRKEA